MKAILWCYLSWVGLYWVALGADWSVALVLGPITAYHLIDAIMYLTWGRRNKIVPRLVEAYRQYVDQRGTAPDVVFIDHAQYAVLVEDIETLVGKKVAGSGTLKIQGCDVILVEVVPTLEFNEKRRLEMRYVMYCDDLENSAPSKQLGLSAGAWEAYVASRHKEQA